MRFFYTFIFILTLVFVAHGQIPSAIKLRCPNPNGSTYGNITVQAGGNIVYWPCPTSSSIFYRTVDFSHATVVGLTGFVTGTGTTNFVPRWTNGAAGVIGNTPFSWNGSIYTWNNTALSATFGGRLIPDNAGGGSLLFGKNAQGLIINENVLTALSGQNVSTFVGDFIGGDNVFTVNDAAGTIVNKASTSITENSTLGTFSAGDTGGVGNSTMIALDDATELISADSRAGRFKAGDVNGFSNGTTLTIDDGANEVLIGGAAALVPSFAGASSIGLNSLPFSSISLGNIANQNSLIGSLATTTRTINFPDAAGTVLLDNGIFTGITTFSLLRTITAAGTTGNQTINKPAGTVNFAAGASALTVTNSTVNANSIIQVTARTNDATCYVKNYVPSGAGSFVINMVAACTAETSVGFIVTN